MGFHEHSFVHMPVDLVERGLDINKRAVTAHLMQRQILDLTIWIGGWEGCKKTTEQDGNKADGKEARPELDKPEVVSRSDIGITWYPFLDDDFVCRLNLTYDDTQLEDEEFERASIASLNTLAWLSRLENRENWVKSVPFLRNRLGRKES